MLPGKIQPQTVVMFKSDSPRHLLFLPVINRNMGPSSYVVTLVVFVCIHLVC